MNVKGTALTTTREFIKKNSPAQYPAWLASLPSGSRQFYAATIDATRWYPLKEGYLIPMGKAAELFFDGNAAKCGEAIGRYSAEVALTGFYKVFLLVASPQYLIKRASKIFTTFYEPSEIGIIEKSPKEAAIRIIKFDGIDIALEYRIAGWIIKALELANCRNPAYKILNSLARGDTYTEISFTWD